MINTPNLWEVREVSSELALELRAGHTPVLVPAQDTDRVTVELAHIKALGVALTEAAADLAEVLTAGGVYHA